MGSTNKSFTILMYPWYAMGHLFPFLVTANKLAARGHKIFLIIPPKTRPRLEPFNLYPALIEFIPMPVPHVEGLSQSVETTNDIKTFEDGQLLRHALDLTKPGVQSLLSDLRPDIVFYDFMHWVPGVARELGIKSVHYCLVSVAAASFLFADSDGFPQLIQQSEHAKRGLKFFETIVEKGSGITLSERVITSHRDSDAIAFNTCLEMEGDYCRFLEKTLKKPILIAGPRDTKAQNSDSENTDDTWGVWLDKFEPRTVIYCAFGSEVVLERGQFQELVLGIEMTGLPFLIAVRPPLGTNTIEESLPDGFTERTGERGVVHGGWVPQHLILNHRAVGCFITHCGYGSMWEGLMSECQLVALPNFGDQLVHAKLLSVVLKVAAEVVKGDEDGLFTKETVHAAVMDAMGKDSQIGKEISDKRNKLRELIINEGFRDSYFDTFVDGLHALLP